jgi:class 3 adenylate cyclase
VRPKTEYARSGDANIAYQTFGAGPGDLVLAVGWVTQLDLAWDIPPLARLYERLGSFSRVILFDKRGTGLSDPVAPDYTPPLEERMDEVRAVMDAAGSERAALLGTIGGGGMCGLFAAMHPDRVERLILYGAFPRMNFGFFGAVPRFADSWDAFLDRLESEWASEDMLLEVLAPSLLGNDRLVSLWGRLSRASVSPGSARVLMQMGAEVDWVDFLPAVRVPTLVLHRSGDRVVPASEGRKLAAGIAGSTYVELPGDDHLMWAGDQDSVIAKIQEFLTGSKPVVELDRILTTIMLTDIVGSTEEAARLGDRRWRHVREEHDRVVRRLLDEYRGREMGTAGDSFLAIFDGPARGIKCAAAIGRELAGLGVSIRAGLHTGECELVGGSIGGLAVSIAARVSALAGSGEILVSSTVKDLVAGSGIEFVDHGEHALKGVPAAWRIFLVA